MHRRAIGPVALAVILVAIASVLAGCGSSGGSPVAAPSVASAWARAAGADGQSAAYFTITNSSPTADALLSASSPAAAVVEVHETSTDDAGMTGMHPVARVEIPAGGSVEFKPGSFHLMLTDLAGELTVGQTIELDLVFEHGGTVVVTAEIRQA